MGNVNSKLVLSRKDKLIESLEFKIKKKQQKITHKEKEKDQDSFLYMPGVENEFT